MLLKNEKYIKGKRINYYTYNERKQNMIMNSETIEKVCNLLIVYETGRKRCEKSSFTIFLKGKICKICTIANIYIN